MTTRRAPKDLNDHYRNTGQFFAGHIDDFLRGYRRNRQQSQMDHIEIVAEKLTVKTILEGIASKYSIPLTISRGQCGPTLKRKIVQRYLISGKDNLILLIVTDLDPAGETIAQNFRDDLEDDFGLTERSLEVYKVALTFDQVTEMNLAPSMEAKDTSPTYKDFVEKYGINDAYELEALEPADLQQILIDAVEEAMDMDAYNAELEQERTDSVDIARAKKAAVEFFKTLDISHD